MSLGMRPLAAKQDAAVDDQGTPEGSAQAHAAQADRVPQPAALRPAGSPARGIVLGLGVSAVIWVVLLVVGWMLFVR